MRVLMLLLNHFVHDSRVHREATALGEAGHDVEVMAVAGSHLPDHEDRGAYRVTRVPLKTRRWRGRLVAPFVHFVEVCLRARQAAGRGQIDVVHAHDSNTLVGGVLAARRAGAALVYDAHELEFARNFTARHLAGVYRHLTYLPEQVFARRADVVLSSTPGYADAMAERYGIPRPRVLLNTPDWPRPADGSPRPTLLRDAFDIPPEAPIALYVGGVLTGRGVEVFLQAAQRVDGLHAVVLGDGPLVPDIQRDIDAGLLTRVHLHPFVPMDDLPPYVASADVGVALNLPTCDAHLYCLPNKLFEYLEAGIPVVVSDLPTMGGLVRDEGVGAVVDPNDIDSVAAGLARTTRPGSDRDAARAAVQIARDRYHWSKQRAVLLEAYEALAAARPSASASSSPASRPVTARRE